MLARLLGVREEDRRDTAVAFATLVIILSAHSMLETARDALFLEKLPATALPLAYIAIAVLALLVSKLNLLATGRVSRRKLLSASLALGGLITAGFWQLTATRTPLMLGALYVWSGLLATVVVVQFWLQLADVLEVDQAKRVFAVIGAGGLVGATAGSVASGALLAVVDARTLLPIAGGLFVVSAVVPLGFSRKAVAAPRRRRHATPQRSGARRFVQDPYLVRLLGMVLVGAVLFTGIDYLFKASVVAASEAQGFALGPFFARYYAIVNGLSLLVQLLLAPRLLRVLGVNRALLVMPALLVAGAAGFVLTAGLLPALLLKGSDGALRHSVHRTASEILYLPLSRSLRERLKVVAEAVGQRGGQALASVLILAAVTLGGDLRVIGAGVAVLAALFLLLLAGLQPHYLDLFRKQLRDGTLDTDVDIPELDLQSFEVLVSALSAEDDIEVNAALDMFEGYGKTELVPALILYHPSREVVTRAFEIFARSQRQDVLRLTGRLLKHEDAAIRAAALRSLAASRPDEELLRGHLDDPEPSVRCTALVALIGAGLADEGEAAQTLRRFVRGDCGDTRLALARALRDLPMPHYRWVAEELVDRGEPELATEVARSLAAAPHPSHLPLLLGMLGLRDAREDTRRALLALGEAALPDLEAALSDRSRDIATRQHLPRTISRFEPDRAAPILLAALHEETEGQVLFKILRGLGRIRARHPDVPIDRDLVLRVTRSTLEEAIVTLQWIMVVRHVVDWRREADTPAAELLIAFLEDRKGLAIQRLFRLLHIVEPTQEFRIIYEGLRSTDPKARASSLELLSLVVPAPLRDGILAMVDDLPPEQQLEAVRPFYAPPGRLLEQVMEQCRRPADDEDAARQLGQLYADALRAMLADRSPALRSIVAYHIDEIGLDVLAHEVAQAAEREGDVLAELTKRALDVLAAPRATELTGAS